jgi:Tol biopolymer transport system component
LLRARIPLFLAVLHAPAPAQDTMLVSVDAEGTGGADSSVSTSARCVAVEQEHRLIVFTSRADDLVKGDANGKIDVFLRDVDAGVTTRVSVDVKGGKADGDGSSASITPDGRFIGLSRLATDLVSGDKNGSADAFLLDRKTGVIERVSLDDDENEIHDDSSFQAVSDDGDVVASRSSSDHVLPGDANGAEDVFLRIRSQGKMPCVSRVWGGQQTGDEFSGSGSLSADGSKVLFLSRATNLVANDTNLTSDVLLYDVGTGQLECMSLNACLELDGHVA